jgi:pyridoxal phosphate enzyme (YggS family)
MSVKDNIRELRLEINDNIKLVAVSKTKSEAQILEAYEINQRIFGENKVQELVQKYNNLPKDIEWHMIGHLQTNKVKYIAKFVSLIHTVDSIKLIKEINKRANKEKRVINCLIQVHIAEEKNKFGFNINEIDDLIKYSEDLDNVNIVGLMGMATFTQNIDIINKEFKFLHKQFKKNKSNIFNILSMGMSNDYQVAIQNGSTMIRLGSTIFGKRN